MDNILFFGYGANRNKQKVTQIIGRNPGEGLGAIVERYNLCYQSLDQIPETTRKFLLEIYGPDFKAYTLKKGQGLVGGTIWELTPEEMDKIRDWEFVGTWRELIKLQARISNNKTLEIITEKAPESANIEDVVDGLLYDEFRFINKKVVGELKQKQYYTQERIKQITAWLNQQSQKYEPGTIS